LWLVVLVVVEHRQHQAAAVGGPAIQVCHQAADRRAAMRRKSPHER
jgi:hypothetical protein